MFIIKQFDSFFFFFFLEKALIFLNFIPSLLKSYLYICIQNSSCFSVCALHRIVTWLTMMADADVIAASQHPWLSRAAIFPSYWCWLTEPKHPPVHPPSSSLSLLLTHHWVRTLQLALCSCWSCAWIPPHTADSPCMDAPGKRML